MNDKVRNPQGEDLGKIEDFMLDTESGRIEYAVLSFGGFLGMGDKLFAVPVQAFRVDTANEWFVLDTDKERLENAPGFDKNNWPSTADTSFTERVYSHYNVPYSRTRTMEPALN
jgi:sporulation protein YlmC with PRC-barrel domain